MHHSLLLHIVSVKEYLKICLTHHENLPWCLVSADYFQRQRKEKHLVNENIKSKILGVAAILFDSRGINASGIDMIIAQTGVAKSTLYRHFPSKDLLIIAFLRNKADSFYEWLRVGLVSQEKKQNDKLTKLCFLLEEWISTPEFRSLPFHIASVEFPDPSHPVYQFSALLAKELQSFLSEIAEEARVSDPQSLGQQLTMLFEGASLVERLTPGTGAATRAKNAALLIIKSSRQK